MGFKEKLDHRVFQSWVDYMAASKVLSKALEEGVDKDQRVDLEAQVRSAKGSVAQARAAREAGNMFPPIRCEG